MLDALRPFATGKLICVIGCGGDRDKGKRPIMGAIAVEKADVVIVTDDNPRTERPEAIRAEILAAAPGAREIGDRAEAIRAGVAMLGEGDVLLVAGKGHETGQIVGDKVLPFSDHEEVARHWRRLPCMTEPLWQWGDLVAAARGRGRRRAGRADHRLLDRHAHAAAGRGVRRPAATCATGTSSSWRRSARARPRRSSRRTTSASRATARCCASTIRCEGLRRHRARCRALARNARIVAVTGSVGKTGTKEALRAVPVARWARRTRPRSPSTTTGACR